MHKQIKIRHINHLNDKISAVDYLLIPVYFLAFKLFCFKNVVMSLPYEIQYPYLFCFNEGLSFIYFVEKLKKLFQIGLYWESSLSDKVNKIYPNLSPSWNLVPEDINLIINLDILNKKKKDLQKIIAERGKQIKFICFNNHQKYIPFRFDFNKKRGVYKNSFALSG